MDTFLWNKLMGTEVVLCLVVLAMAMFAGTGPLKVLKWVSVALLFGAAVLVLMAVWGFVHPKL